MRFLNVRVRFAIISISLAAAATVQAQDPVREIRAGEITTMTQNLYVGGNILAPLNASSLEEFQQLAALVVGQIIATNFPERAGALSDLMLRERPHLIGLQEVYIIRVCLQSNPAICPLDQDSLDILLDELNAGEDLYREVASVTNIDLQGIPAALPDGTPVLVTLTDRDVIVARRGVRTSNAVEFNFEAGLPVENPLLPSLTKILRGYTMVDAEVLGRSYRFVNAHLEITSAGSPQEPFFRAVQFAQALELIGPGGPLFGDDHVQIVVGDFNSDPTDGPLVDCFVPGVGVVPEGCPTPYALLTTFAYIDTWTRRGGPWSDGLTCCQATLLNKMESELQERVDLIWVRQAPDHFGGPVVRGVRADVVGEDQQDKTVNGLWPSDHAGVAAGMVLRVPN